MRRSRTAQRVLATLLFTDMVDSTTLATALGDTRWKDVQGRHHETMRRLLREHGGKELDTAGDGFFARFDDPASAIRCAVAASEALREIGVEIRAGVHVGQCEVLGSKLTGINVVVAARIMGLGTAGEVLISRTARDIVGGADIETRDRGIHQLKGVDGDWDVLAVTAVDGDRRTEPLTREESIARLFELEASATQRRRRSLLLAAIAVVVLFLTITGVVQARSHHGTIASAPTDSVAELDTSTGSIVDVTTTGKGPRALATTSTGLWVAETERSVVEFIGNDGTRQAIGMHCAPTSLAAADDGSVWVLCRSSNQLAHIDASTQTVETQIPLHWPDGYTGLAIGGGTVWVTNAMHHTIELIDADTGASQGAPIAVGAEPSAIAFGDDAAWFLSGDQLFRLELTGDRQKIASVSLRWPGDGLAIGPDAVWVIHSAHDQVTRVDPSDLQQVGQIAVGNQPQSIAVNSGGAWITNYLDGSVTNVSESGETTTYAVGSGPYDVAADDAHVWVSMAGRA